MPSYTIRQRESIYSGNPQARGLVRGAGGILYASYEHEDAATLRQAVSVSRSLDQGRTWSIIITIAGANDYQRPSMAIDSSGRLHLVYEEVVGANTFSKYRTWSAGVLGAEIDLEAPVWSSSEAMVAVDSQDAVHIIYSYVNNISYKKRQGGAWVIDEQLPPVVPGGAVDPSIAIDSAGNVHAVFVAQPVTWDVCYQRRTSAGWGAREQLTNDAVFERYTGIVVDSSNNIHLVWSSPAGVYYRARINGVWQPTETVSLLDYVGAIAINKVGVITVAMRQRAAPLYIFYRQKLIGGAWGTRTNLSGVVNNTDLPNLIWANYPIIAGARTNVPVTGFALAYQIYAPIPDELDYFVSAGVFDGGISNDLAWNAKPTAQTLAATDVLRYNAALNGELVDGGGELCNVGFEWGTDPQSLDFLLNVSSGVSASSFSVTVCSLLPETTYYFRAFATNSVGTGYGSIRSFTTGSVLSPIPLPPGSYPPYPSRPPGLFPPEPVLPFVPGLPIPPTKQVLYFVNIGLVVGGGTGIALILSGKKKKKKPVTP